MGQLNLLRPKPFYTIEGIRGSMRRFEHSGLITVIAIVLIALDTVVLGTGALTVISGLIGGVFGTDVVCG